MGSHEKCHSNSYWTECSKKPVCRNFKPLKANEEPHISPLATSTKSKTNDGFSKGDTLEISFSALWYNTGSDFCVSPHLIQSWRKHSWRVYNYPVLILRDLTTTGYSDRRRRFREKEGNFHPTQGSLCSLTHWIMPQTFIESWLHMGPGSENMKIQATYIKPFHSLSFLKQFLWTVIPIPISFIPICLWEKRGNPSPPHLPQAFQSRALSPTSPGSALFHLHLFQQLFATHRPSQGSLS